MCEVPMCEVQMMDVTRKHERSNHRALANVDVKGDMAKSTLQLSEDDECRSMGIAIRGRDCVEQSHHIGLAARVPKCGIGQVETLGDGYNDSG